MLLTTTTLIMAGIESLGGFMAMFALNMADYPRGAPPAASPTRQPAGRRHRGIAALQHLGAALPPLPARRTSTLHGQTMRAGDFVCLAYGSGNRDERQFPNPDVYDIARKPRGHLGFGGGVHACLGDAIARLARARSPLTSSTR